MALVAFATTTSVAMAIGASLFAAASVLAWSRRTENEQRAAPEGTAR
jgi:hypothetical protein